MRPHLLVHEPGMGFPVFRAVELSGLQWLEMATQAAICIAQETATRHEYWQQGGCDGPNPYDETAAALAQLKRALTATEKELQALAQHAHEWNGNDYCAICGADGRA